MANKKIDFYFDISSPYSYLAHTQIRKYEKETGEKINYMPIFLGGLHRLADITAPGLNPLKGKYLIKDLKLFADKYKIKYQFNRYFPIKTIQIMRGAIVAGQNDYFQNYIDKFFIAAWVDSLNLNDEKIFEKFLKNMDINYSDFIQKLSDPKIKDELKDRTDSAFKKGIFGAPTFVVNGKMFWGQDRLEFVFKEAKK
jgi:2-hydroxychromene-2-carboxylate isomerase